MSRPRVLVACEFSGTVRDAFLAAGADAVSCDLLPGEVPGPHHEGDVRPLLRERWDLVVAHPPCTYLANSGVRWLYQGGRRSMGRDEARWALMREAAGFFRECLEANAPRVCVENPVMHGWAELPRPSYTCQPWQFGHGESKRVCLWLRRLPPLMHTRLVAGREQRVHRMAPGEGRGRERSRFFGGIAEAMASQWLPRLAA